MTARPVIQNPKIGVKSGIFTQFEAVKPKTLNILGKLRTT